jgi:mannose-6-phosphate isomerase-like protein (cupin superfamily)
VHLNKLEEELKDLRIPLQEDDVLDLLQIRKRWPLKYPWGQYGVEILNSNGILVFPFYSYDGYFVYEEWKKYYDNCFMTVLNSVLDLTKELRELDLICKRLIGDTVNANFVFAKPGGQKISYTMHEHDFDVVVKQIYGTGHWLVGGEEVTLKANDTLLVPRFTRHEVVKTTDKKLSIGITIP